MKNKTEMCYNRNNCVDGLKYFASHFKYSDVNGYVNKKIIPRRFIQEQNSQTQVNVQMNQQQGILTE